MTAPDRRTRLDRAHPMLSIRRQCVLLSVSRSGVYRPQPPANDDADLTLMRRIDELSMAWPFLGSRRIMAMLRTEGDSIKCRSKNRQSELRLVRIRCVRSSATVSTKVSAGCSATTASALAPCSVVETLPPHDFGAALPLLPNAAATSPPNSRSTRSVRPPRAATPPFLRLQ